MSPSKDLPDAVALMAFDDPKTAPAPMSRESLAEEHARHPWAVRRDPVEHMVRRIEAVTNAQETIA